MTVFVLIAAAMLAAALGLVLPPLLKRESSIDGPSAATLISALNLDVLRDHQRELDAELGAGMIDAAAHGAAQQELWRRVVEDVPATLPPPLNAGRQREPALLVALAVPLLALFLYAMLGNPNGLRPRPAPAEAAPAAAVGQEQIEAMVGRLAARLKTQPDDVNGWRMLSRSYETLRRFDQAADAYRHLLALEPKNTDAMLDYAVVLGMTLNGSLIGEPEALIARALAIDPHHVQALALAGSAALERGDGQGAVRQWKKILALVPESSEMARSIADSIAKAEARAGAAR